MTATTLPLLYFLSLFASFASARPSPALLQTRYRKVTASSKTGLAWPNGNSDNISQYYQTNKASWYYTWSPEPVDDNTLEFVPMLWGSTQTSDFASSINGTISSKNVTTVLGMNEPNLQGQSDITPQDGATMWQTYIQPLKAQGLRLGSPAPTSAPDGKTWLQAFLTACDGCTVDFIALHYYDVNATNFISYVTDMHSTFNLPIWVTEWACQNYNNGPQCDSASVAAFMNQTQSFMDQTDWVERYSWFGAMENMQGVNQDNALMDKKGAITQLGQQYIGANTGSGSGSGNGSGPSKSSAIRLAASCPISSWLCISLFGALVVLM